MIYGLIQDSEFKISSESSDENEQTSLINNNNAYSENKNLIFANISNISYKEKKLSQLSQLIYDTLEYDREEEKGERFYPQLNKN